jgi:lipid II isoglutaminyl synthase (glutamine-hydrolysing)
MTGPSPAARRLVMAHLFPELLNLYGDLGNIRVLVQRGRWRGYEVEVRSIGANDEPAFDDVDLVFIGGGQDRQQIAVARALERLAAPLAAAIGRGASLLAVCGGYQNLGHLYRSELVGELRGPGLLDVTTEATSNADRFVGGVVMELPADSPIAALGRESAAAAGHPEAALQLVGFENHSGRTHLGPGVRPLGRVRVGGGNDGEGAEGAITLPGEGGLDGLRIGTYLHGPLLSRNPHLADFLILSGLRHRGVTQLDPLDDRAEWAAHVAFADHWQTIPRPGRARGPLGRAVERFGNLLGPSR